MQMHKTYNVDIQTRSETNNTWKTCKGEILPKWLHPGELNTLLVTVNQKVDHQIFLIKYWPIFQILSILHSFLAILQYCDY